MNFWNSLKTIVYIISGILIIIFRKPVFYFIEYIVSAVIIAYGINFLVTGILKKTLFTEKTQIAEALANILVGIALILTGNDTITLCVIWGVWSILRESKEIGEIIPELVHKKIGFLDIFESLVIVVLSFILILEPTEHHIQFHITILGIELILEVLFPLFNKLIEKLYEYVRNKRLATNSTNSTNNSDVSN